MQASVTSRFLTSLAANLSRALLAFVTGLIVARGLGPEQYGKMMFLLGTFVAARQILDMGSSTAFFTLLSQRGRSKRFVGWFAVWLALQFIVPLLAIGLLFPAAWIELVWKGEQRGLVLLAFMASYAQLTLWSVLMQMGESQRLTRRAQGLGVLATGIHLLLVTLAWWQDWLSVPLILAAMILEWVAAVGLLAGHLRFSSATADDDGFASVMKEFGPYCLPLIPYAWLGFAYEFADRWLLQTYGGSVQQAYYAVAYQFGALAGIATASMLNVLWKEIAEAHYLGNRERVAMLYRRTSRSLYFVAAALAGFLLPWSETLLKLTVGEGYTGGATALMIMMLYPLHQSIGQVGGTMLYATGLTRIQAAVGMTFMAISIAATYFVLAPADAAPAGLGLGSAGLAGKMVVLQIFAVNVIAVLLARRLEMPFDWLYQPVSAAVCIITGWAAYGLVDAMLAGRAHVALAAAVAGVLYGAVLAGVVWFFPGLTGMTKAELQGLLRRLVL